MSGPPGDLPTAAPTEFIELVEQLNNSAELSGHRLAGRLRRALNLHDLNRQELLAAQRDVIRLRRIGALPAPNEYWRRSALPRAAIMVDASMAAVVEEGHLLGEALDRFLDELDSPALIDWTEDSLDRRTLDHTTGPAIARLLGAVPPTSSIHALGSWWQRRLRRAAVLRSIPRLLASDADPDQVIGRSEMALLDRAPWSHGDRLLSAFELAHGEIRTQTELVAEGLTSRVSTRGRRYLTPSARVTIELRR